MGTTNKARLLSRRGAIAAGASLLAVPPKAAVAETRIRPRTDLDQTYDSKTDAAICLGLDLLIDRQQSDGSFATEEQGEWVGVCALAGLAWLSRGIRPGIGAAGTALKRTADFIASCCQTNGLITGKQTSRGPMYDHGFGTLFLAEYLGTGKGTEIAPKLSSAVQLIVRTQNRDGGWRYDPVPRNADLSITVAQMMALRAARNAGIGVPKETIDRAIQYIRGSQNPDGGFMYQITGGPSRFPLTAAGVVAMYSAGVYEGTEVEQGIAYLKNNIKANRSPGRDKFFYYAHYYSAQAFLQTGSNSFASWYRPLRDVLLSHQNDKGGWFDFHGIEYATAMSCLILNMPRSLLPIFQR